ncbi:hypothetical protein [Kribbella sp. CA-293567]|uniref:hypothetical protein n=1 Tax=Kribbella sp. CA-293567 TaxID=3002436 RepID=UPI0022DDA803|nr:hypothetical protein [Kribbella sp. CA-293567]WBQ03348.1 hypothetical protein OX958_25640 [Kribbella sp. CA-293567]
MMIFTRRFGALAARPQFPDAPELQQELTVDAELQQHDAGRSENGEESERITTAA